MCRRCLGNEMLPWPSAHSTFGKPKALGKAKGGAEQSQAFQMPLQDFTQAHELSG